MKRILIAAAVLVIAFGLGAAAPKAADKVSILKPWVATPVGKRDVTAAFLTLRNSGSDTALVSASCDVVKKLELHTMDESEGMMRMKMVERIALPKGKDVKLHPGGLHLMFIGLTRPIAAGEKLAVTLRFADGSSKVVDMPVQARGEE